MKRRLLKALIGVSIVLSQLGVLLWMFWMTRSYFTVKQAVNLSASISPVLAISLVVVIKDFLRQKASPSLSSSRVPFELALISFILLAFYVVALVLCCVGFPDTITSIEDLKTYFLGIQSIFGAYLGYVIDVLFYPKAA